jgi:hypothetical protein
MMWRYQFVNRVVVRISLAPAIGARDEVAWPVRFILACTSSGKLFNHS